MNHRCSEQLYASGYDDAAVDIWNERVAIRSRGGHSLDGRLSMRSKEQASLTTRRFMSFDNDMKVREQFDAIGLCKYCNTHTSGDAASGYCGINLCFLWIFFRSVWRPGELASRGKSVGLTYPSPSLWNSAKPSLHQDASEE